MKLDTADVTCLLILFVIIPFEIALTICYIRLFDFQVQHQAGFSGYWKCVKRETLKGAQEALGDGRCPI